MHVDEMWAANCEVIAQGQRIFRVNASVRVQSKKYGIIAR